MKNPSRGSLNHSLGKNAHTFPVPNTFNTPLTPSQAEKAARFMAMLTPKAASDALAVAGLSISQGEAEQQDKGPVIRQLINGETPKKDWLARECEELAEIIDNLEAEREAQRIEGIPGSLEEAKRRLYAAQSARVHIQTIAATLEPDKSPSADEVAGAEVLEALKPTRGKGARTEGPVRLWRLLHLLAVYKAERSGHHPSAAQEVLHTANELLAAALRVNPKTITNWAEKLQQAGKIDAREHKGKHLNTKTGEIQTRNTGMVYAVALQPGHVAHLSYADLHHQYRNLDADRAGGRTAYRYAKKIKALYNAEKNMSESNNSQEGAAGDAEQTALRVLQAWTVTPGRGQTFLDPRYSFDPDIFREDEKPSMQTVIYALPMIAEEQDADRRRVLVHHAATNIAAALDDDHSRSYYAGLIWQAIKGGWKGLQALASQLARFEVDRREWGIHMRHAPALLTSRTRVTA